MKKLWIQYNWLNLLFFSLFIAALVSVLLSCLAKDFSFTFFNHLFSISIGVFIGVWIIMEIGFQRKKNVLLNAGVQELIKQEKLFIIWNKELFAFKDFHLETMKSKSNILVGIDLQHIFDVKLKTKISVQTPNSLNSSTILETMYSETINSSIIRNLNATGIMQKLEDFISNAQTFKKQFNKYETRNSYPS